MQHEKAYLNHLEAQGVSICDLRDLDDDTRAIAETVAAMEGGAEAIAQATLSNGRWFGRADVLRRVERTSRLGSWSYEVYDCKLARETKAATVLQLSLYSDLVEAAQGALPESMYVVPPKARLFKPSTSGLADLARVTGASKAESMVGATKVFRFLSSLKHRKPSRSGLESLPDAQPACVAVAAEAFEEIEKAASGSPTSFRPGESAGSCLKRLLVAISVKKVENGGQH
jgi:hypothetical protein